MAVTEQQSAAILEADIVRWHFRGYASSSGRDSVNSSGGRRSSPASGLLDPGPMPSPTRFQPSG